MNVVMDFEDTGCRARFLIRDRDGKFPALFDTVLKGARIDVVLTGVRMPRMNALTERRVQTCRHELLDRTLIWNQHHLLHVLREFEQHDNSHRPHQGIADARPLHPLPPPITDSDAFTHLTYDGATASAAPSTSTSMRPDLHRRDSRTGQGTVHRTRPHRAAGTELELREDQAALRRAAIVSARCAGQRSWPVPGRMPSWAGPRKSRD
ncbi:integrase core domain-containing protein [Streptomyces sp. NPDC048523]|uniref:integrase core domain-containing protein n=1 Tax=Streptomyces sp. NPDC048523 TaxID=3365567 RepID=UPI0037159BC0